MKGKQVWLLAAALCMAGIVGCMNRQEAGSGDRDGAAADSLLSDSLVAEADTFLLDLETLDAPLPETMDELFDDFIFSFDQSNRLQRSRIRFPLPVVSADGETRYVEAREWQHHYLFLHQDFYTVLWNGRSQMSLAEDSAVCHARVDQIYLHSREIVSYVFQRDSLRGEWMLTEECRLPFEHTDLAPFLDFYSRFATDSIYQRRHVADPLRFATSSEEGDFETIEGTINADQWFEFQPEMPQDVLVHIAYGQTYSNPHRMLLQFRGISNGLQNLFVFQCEGERWRLVRFEN
ncbi:MAG: DUF4348 domain-containing protein [Bacteroidaceae bacterium]|nr:DUF4348 domain-containing protein [Bacteroidaceae bacterium]